MKLARGIERRLENLVDGVSASVFRGRMHPVTIATRLVRQVDFLAFPTTAGPQIPNDLTVVLHPADLDASIDVPDLEAGLGAVVSEAAAENGWRLVGPVEVHLETSVEVPRGILQCAGDSVAGRLPPWAQLIANDGSVAVPLTLNRTLVGRALDCDVRFSNTEISRHHAVISRVDTRVEVADLGSANGTWVNRDRIDRAPVALVPGCSLSFGDLSFVFRPVS